MRWFLQVWFISALLFFCFPKLSLAQSDYVLPYPSSMPGNKTYVFRELWEKVSKFWYFGNFGQFTYNRELSDKYLVEAKTLFEYKQYLLAAAALKKSDMYFGFEPSSLVNAKREGKLVTQKQSILKMQANKHIETLEIIKSWIPSQFIWQDEHKKPVVLTLHESIQASIQKRRSCL